MTLIKRNFPSFGRFFDDDFFTTPMTENAWSPAINVVDNESDYQIEVAAPGMKKEDFNVSVENGFITLKGESKKEDEEKEKNYTRKEFSYKSFTKSFKLPDNVKEGSISAKHEDGVLRLTLKKSGEQLPPKKDVEIE